MEKESSAVPETPVRFKDVNLTRMAQDTDASFGMNAASIMISFGVLSDRADRGPAEYQAYLVAKLAEADTAEKVWHIYDCAPKGSATEQIALEKLETLLALDFELAAADTLEKIRRVYERTPTESQIRQKARQKALGLVRDAWKEWWVREDVPPYMAAWWNEMVRELAFFYTK